jgi:hypothetical protein
MRAITLEKGNIYSSYQLVICTLIGGLRADKTTRMIVVLYSSLDEHNVQSLSNIFHL